MKQKPSFFSSIQFAIIIVILLALIGWGLSSCNYLAQISEDIIHIDPPDNPTDTIHVDTIEPIVIDTCDSYHEITNLKWTSWALNMDVFAQIYHWYLWPDYVHPIDLDSLLDTYGESTIYYSGINICGVIDGFENQAQMLWLNQHLYSPNGPGLFYIDKSVRNFTFNGALTFDQFYSLLTTHSNFKRLGFWNTAFTCDQYNQVIDFLIDNCITGSGKVIDLRYVNGCISQDKIGLLQLAGYTVIQ